MNLGNSSKALAVLACAVCLAVCLAPAVSQDADAADYYRFEIHADGTVSGTYTSIGTDSDGYWSSADGSNVGSWGFNSSGYGPFNSFYAAFDPYNGNAMVCILDPNDLTRSIDGEDVSGCVYNIMWVIPTVYWDTEEEEDGDGWYLILSNDPSNGNAYAHNVSGKTYDYLAIGVYEASTIEVEDETYIASASGAEPVTGETRTTYREWANTQEVENGTAMLWNFYQYELYVYCATIVMGGFDSQAIAGNGDVTGGSPVTAGSLDQAGPYAGTTGSDTTSAVKVFIENAWGSVAEMVDGTRTDGRKTMYIDYSSIPTDAGAGETYVNTVDPSFADTGWGTEVSTAVRIWGVTTSSSQDYEESITHDMIVSSSGERMVVVGGGCDADDYREYGLHYMDVASLGMNGSDSGTGTRLAFVFNGESSGEDGGVSIWVYAAVAVIVILVIVAAILWWAYRRKNTV